MELNMPKGIACPLSLAYSTRHNYQPVCKGYPNTWRIFNNSKFMASDFRVNGDWDNIVRAKEEISL